MAYYAFNYFWPQQIVYLYTTANIEVGLMAVSTLFPSAIIICLTANLGLSLPLALLLPQAKSSLDFSSISSAKRDGS